MKNNRRIRAAQKESAEERHVRIVRISPLFDKKWYKRQYPDIGDVDPALHFVRYGWKEKRNPGPFFITSEYLKKNKDIARCAVNPLVHYETSGKREGRNIGYNPRIREKIKKSVYFNESWYKKTYSDVEKSGLDPLVHYLVYGWRKGYNPSERFDTLLYLKNYPDVEAASVCPLQHYVVSGKKEGRVTGIENDKRLYCEIINITPIDNGYSAIFTYSSVNKDNVTLQANGITLERNTHMSANMEFLLHKLQGNHSFFIIPDEVLYCGNAVLSAFFGAQKMYLRLRNENLLDSHVLNRKGVVVSCKGMNTCVRSKSRTLVGELLSFSTSIKSKLILLLCLFSKKRYSLYGELSFLNNDNVWELYKHIYEKENDAYYIIGKELEKSIKGVPKSRIVIKNSFKHLWMLIHSRRLVTSYTKTIFLHKDIKDFHFGFLNYNYNVVWHGISCDDKDSIVYRHMFGTPDLCCACSAYEKEFFEQKCEYPLVKVTGYPRMDKWYNARIDNKTVFVFFTWRKNIKTRKQLLESEYYQQLQQVVSALVDEKYRDYTVVIGVYHYFYILFRDCFEALARNGSSVNVKIISASNGNEFNHYFAAAKYMITDYSSVGYDNAYKKDALTIYYLPDDNDKFTDGHYNLTDKFYKRHCGCIVKSPKEIKEVIMNECIVNKEINERRERFFSYFDSDNCERVYRAIYNSDNI